MIPDLVAPELAAEWAPALDPPPDLLISEWAERYRALPQASAARGSRWRNETAPYLVGIMDAARDPGVKKIALMKSHQSGGSEALNNILGYHMQHDPCPMLLVHPTSEVAEEYSKERLGDMIRTTPALAAIVTERAQAKTRGQADSTLTLKLFHGGYLALGGAKTPNTFARWSARIAIGDDVDRFPAEVGDEGDPAELLTNRTTSFYDALSIFVSTPTLKGGRIDALYARSDQRRYFVPCPGCGRDDYITWNDPAHFRVAYDDEDPETARIECPAPDFGGCGASIYEPERREIVARGEWRPSRRSDEPGLVGFHLPAMVSTLGDVTLPRLVSKWLVARKEGPKALKAFVNTWLAEAWEERGERVESSGLLRRRESYGEGIDVPAAAPCLTAGVDVQADRFELQVQAWGPADERWVVDYQVIPGDPKLAATQEALLAALGARYRHASGHMLPIHAVCIDTGYATDEMYDLVLRHQHRRFYATKGFAGLEGEPVIKFTQKRYGKRGLPVQLGHVNVDDAKADVMNGLLLPVAGPRYIHFPDQVPGVDEEYFAQLCAEHRETVRGRNGVATHAIWVQHRARNEALDTAVLCLAAFRAMKPNLRSMADTLARTPVPPGGGAAPAPTGTPQPQQQTRPAERRVRRSGYLG